MINRGYSKEKASKKRLCDTLNLLVMLVSGILKYLFLVPSMRVILD